MMNRFVGILLALAMVATFTAVPASAATAAPNQTPAQVGSLSDEALDAMGLSGMERLSEEEGLQIRGKGIFALNFVIIHGNYLIYHSNIIVFQSISIRH